MIEYRTASAGVTGDKDTLHGMVTPFNVWTNIGDAKRGGFRERIAPGTFAKTLQERDIVLVHSHNTGLPLARTSVESGATGSLTLREDPNTGLNAVAKPVQTSTGKDVLLLAEAGVLRGMSFGFDVLQDSWTDDEGRASDAQNGTQRTIREVRLHEITTTAFPAYETTTLSARDSINAARGVAESRDAVASYGDLNTCAECGSTDEYGPYCSGCGGDMAPPVEDSPDYCSACGSAMRAKNTDGSTRSPKPVSTTLDEEHAADLVRASQIEAAMRAVEMEIPE